MSEADIKKYEAPELEGKILGTRMYAGELTIDIDPTAVNMVCRIFKEKFGFNYLSDISSIDYFTDEKRFGVAYNIVNIDTKERIRLSCRVDEENPEVDTVCDVWTAATWFEREAWDMMGIRFTNHPDLRRLFMPEDFEYFPMRKEFPLLGIPGSIEMPEPAPPKEYK